MSIIFTLALLGAVVPIAPIIEQPVAPLPHVRALSPTAREIVAAGLHESTTFRQLVCELDAANIVVYVATTPEWATRASLNYLSSAASITYVLVHVRTSPRTRSGRRPRARAPARARDRGGAGADRARVGSAAVVRVGGVCLRPAELRQRGCGPH